MRLTSVLSCPILIHISKYWFDLVLISKVRKLLDLLRSILSFTEASIPMSSAPQDIKLNTWNQKPLWAGDIFKYIPYSNISPTLINISPTLILQSSKQNHFKFHCLCPTGFPLQALLSFCWKTSPGIFSFKSPFKAFEFIKWYVQVSKKFKPSLAPKSGSC